MATTTTEIEIGPVSTLVWYERPVIRPKSNFPEPAGPRRKSDAIAVWQELGAQSAL